MEGDPPMKKEQPEPTRRDFIADASAYVAVGVAASAIPNAVSAASLSRPVISDRASEMMRSDDFAELMDPKYKRQQLALKAYQHDLRDPEKRKIQRDPRRAQEAFRDAVVDDPRAHFEMLTNEKKKEIREFYNRCSVVLSSSQDG